MRRFNDHLGRLGAMLTEGRHVAEVAVYHPVRAAWAAYTPTARALQPPGEAIVRVHQVFADTCNVLLRDQRDYDVVDDEAILEAEIAGRALRVRDEAFRCLVLPAAAVISLEVFRKAGQFAAASGRVVFVEPTPRWGLSPEESEAIGETWPGLFDAKRFRLVAEAEGLPAVIDELLERDVTLDEPAPMLVYVHRVRDARHVYFVANCGDEPLTRRVTFRCPGRPELWHPTTGEVGPLAVAMEARGSVTVSLDLEAFEGVFVVF
jgi:hypothetical protein